MPNSETGHEVKSLLGGSSSDNQKNAASKPSNASFSSKMDVKKIVAVAFMVLIAYVLFSSGGNMSEQNNGEIHQTLHKEKKENDVIPKQVGAPKNVPAKDVKQKVDSMKEAFHSAKTQLIESLSKDYGSETMFAMFFEAPDALGNRQSLGRSIFRSGDPGSSISWDRFKRKLMMKLLQLLLGETDVRFVWATGGHSSSAGHGNFFHESYTAVMERSAKGVFEAVGLELEARNYAMGGTSSALEVAMCSREIYGMDIDALSWDFGMTDGNAMWKQTLYHWKAGMNPGRPINVAIHCGGRSNGARVNIVSLVEMSEQSIYFWIY